MKLRRRAALAILLVLSIGLGSLGVAVTNGWIGRTRINAGDLEYAFRTAGGVWHPDLGSDYRVPLDGMIDKPGNFTLPSVGCDAYAVYSQMVVGADVIEAEEGIDDGINHGRPIATGDVLVIDYATTIRAQAKDNTTLIQAAAIKDLEIHLNNSIGFIDTTEAMTYLSENRSQLIINYLHEEMQSINSTPWLVSSQRSTRVTFDGNISLALEASWSISVKSVDGAKEYFRTSRTLATWNFTPPDPVNATSLPSVSGDFHCYMSSCPLSVACSSPFYIDIPPLDPKVEIIGITMGTLGVGIVLVAWCFHHDRLDRARGSTPPDISASDEEGHL